MGLAALLVMIRVLFNAWINLLQKRLVRFRFDAILIVAIMMGLLTILMLPVFVWLDFKGLSLLFWGAICIAAVLDTIGNVFLVHSVGKTDLSIFGPLNAYKPIIAMLFGAILLRELPSWPGLIGILIILLGSILLSPDGQRVSFRSLPTLFRDPGVRYRLLSLMMIAGAAIFLKAGIERSSPLHAFVIWVLAGAPVSVAGVYLFSPADYSGAFSMLRTRLGSFILLVVFFFLMQIVTFQLFHMMKVAYALALFQLSAVVNVLFGYRFFREKYLLQRITASLIMILGAACIILWG